MDCPPSSSSRAPRARKSSWGSSSASTRPPERLPLDGLKSSNGGSPRRRQELERQEPAVEGGRRGNAHPRLRYHNRPPRFPPSRGKHRLGRRAWRHRRRRRRGRRQEGGPDCEQRAGDGSRDPLRESPPLRPGWEPPARRRRGSRSTFPSKRSPPNTALGPSRIRKTGVIAVGHAQLGGSSWRHRSS